MLSEAVLSDHDKKEKDPRKLHELLRKGAIAFLGEDEETALKNSNAFINDDIDKILQSGYHHEDLITKAKSKSMFSEVTFEIDNSNSKDLDINADDFWEKALQVRESRISKLKNSFLENLTLLKSNKEMLRDVLGIIKVLLLNSFHYYYNHHHHHYYYNYYIRKSMENSQ